MNALTQEQQLEMYGDIKVIKANCTTCNEWKKSVDDRLSIHSKFITGLSAVGAFTLGAAYFLVNLVSALNKN